MKEERIKNRHLHEPRADSDGRQGFTLKQLSLFVRFLKEEEPKNRA